MNIFKKLNGRIRMMFLCCPECNTTAPKLYNCKVCEGKMYPYTDNTLTMSCKFEKRIVWKRFLNQQK